MTVEDWKEELFSLYKHCRLNSAWPDNYKTLLEWVDEDAKEYLQELDRLYKSGAFN